jgi:hypothetical protein
MPIDSEIKWCKCGRSILEIKQAQTTGRCSICEKELEEKKNEQDRNS